MNKNVLVLAYLGDSIYVVYIRKYLIDKNISKVKELQSESIKYVSAKSQRSYLEKMLNDMAQKQNDWRNRINQEQNK